MVAGVSGLPSFEFLDLVFRHANHVYVQIKSFLLTRLPASTVPSRYKGWWLAGENGRQLENDEVPCRRKASVTSLADIIRASMSHVDRKIGDIEHLPVLLLNALFFLRSVHNLFPSLLSLLCLMAI
jgi:hypothetical protein